MYVVQIGMRNYQESIVGDEALVTYTITNIGHGRVNLRGEFEMIIEVTTIWNLVDLISRNRSAGPSFLA